MRRSEIEWREEDTEVELGHLYRMETRRELRPWTSPEIVDTLSIIDY
jgi:hypothetical protein